MYQLILFSWLLVSNLIAFLFDLADIGYYPYVRKRMTFDVFDLIGRKSDFVDLLPSYLIKFWYITIFILLFSWGYWYLASHIQRKFPHLQNEFKWSQAVLFVLSLGISILGIRGGLQLKPILINHAMLVTDNEFAPLVYNTPFSILHSFETQKLGDQPFPNLNIPFQYVQTKKHFRNAGSFNKKNIVIIVLESFGKYYTGSGRKSYTPFLDSLSNQGFYFNKAFANAATSATGIPAIVAGIPNFYNEAFATSPYGSNKIDALPNLLKTYAYHSSFYHGGTNGTMNFDVFSRNAGYSEYYGRNEYPNDKDYDGTWGIYDYPYLQYFAKQLNQEKQPFLATLFTLSSHEPFKVPNPHPSFLDTLHEINKGIAYTDYALKAFFKKVSVEPWYQNTLFVLTADHPYMACQDSAGYYNSNLGLYAIPVIFYDPGNPKLKGVSNQLFQQINILPTILDYLHYPKPFYALGNSGFKNEHPFVYHHLNGRNLFYYNDTMLNAQDTLIRGMFTMKEDSMMNKGIPIVNNSTAIFFKEILHTLHRDIKHNTMSYRP